ncbi:MAG: hypothetical protein J1F28_06225 [Oscillospiraceae bacterium]|nr:hypothetical protein [Oscillospiraceae bacterium]
MGNFKWIPLVGQNLSAANLAAAEKLRKFGFALNCGEFGSEKYVKCALCVYDVLAEKENPNILVITNESEIYSWYRMFITSIGADFKMVSGAQNALLIFDEEGAGLFLMTKNTLFSDNNVLRRKANENVKWDLIIIDEELTNKVPDYKGYKNHIVWKAEKLLINSPFPANSDGDKADLAELVKGVLADGEKAAAASSMTLGASACALSDESPVMRYYDPLVYSDDYKREVVFIDYGFEDSVINTFRRRVDLRSGLPTYTYGGNIFEQYDVDKYEKQKKIYMKSYFTRSDVEDLAELDKKLEALLKYSSEILVDDDARIMIYCCNKNTVEYLRKVFSSLYGSQVFVERGETITPQVIINKLSVDTDIDERPRVIIGMDNLSTTGEGMQTVTCVINYELPFSAAVLEKRMTRHGFSREKNRKFVIFRDSNKVFDSVVLERNLCRSIGEAFCGALPTRNIMFDIKEKGVYMAGLVASLKYVRDHAQQAESGFDFIKKVKADFSLVDNDEISNTKQLTDFADKTLNKIYTLLGINDRSSPAEIAAAMNEINGLCLINDSGKIEKMLLRDEMAASFSDNSYSNQPFASEAVKGLEDAKAEVDALENDKEFHIKIKNAVRELHDVIQYPVMYGIWKYREKQKKQSGSQFKEYIRIFNDGI